LHEGITKTAQQVGEFSSDSKINSALRNKLYYNTLIVSNKIFYYVPFKLLGLHLLLLEIYVIKTYVIATLFNPLKTKSSPLYLIPNPYRAVNTFHLGYKYQSVYGVSGTSRCFFSDKYETR
jgi:hypothetical protein